MAAPTLEEFRRWLQAEIDDILNQEQDLNISKRLIQLETALQEAMAFTAAWDMRTESNVKPVIQEASVRLLSSSDDFSTQPSTKTGLCQSCEEIIEDDLPFCPACGENR